MHIKQIIIQGFKSYKDQTVIEPFSPKHNVIVGRNGSGKSNFFSAIRFVLSDAYTQLGREERQALLHEGSGAAVMSAYVEIIFDNTDERFPTGKDEVILRRTIGNKKDEYSLDRKNATKADVMNLLESAGFSRSNPYYIVPQGRVTALTSMKDTERLLLLKEVAGTQVYEARRGESIRIMGETDAKRAKIDELLTYITDRLEELEEEKEELKEFQTSDKERRCLEYLIYRREQEEITRALDNLEEQRVTGSDEVDENRQRFVGGEERLMTIDQEIKDLRQKLELLKVDRKQYDGERREALRTRAKVELEINNIAAGQESAQTSRSQRDQDLSQVRQSIQEREQQLARILPEYGEARREEAELQTRLTEATSNRQRLYAKQGRNAQFANKAARDNWLQKEIGDVNVAMSTRKAQRMGLNEDLQVLQKEVEQAESAVTEIRTTLDSRSESMQSVNDDVETARETRDKLIDQRKELWREQAKLDSVVRNAQQDYDRAERFLSHMMDQNTSRGLAAVRRIKQQRNLTGAYGTLGELFEVAERYKTAVEVTAGTSLFHYVVDTEETASQLVDLLQKERAGRVTFMPINRLRPRPANIPRANDAIEMISKLTYDATYEKAFQQVFGKTIICPNLQIASQYARSHGVSAITPEGDRSDKKGALTGGYYDPRQSRLDGIKKLTKSRNEYEQHREHATKVQRDIERTDQEVTRAVSELQKAEQRRQQQENIYGPLQQELRNTLRAVQEKQDALEVKQRAIENLESQVKDLSGQQSSYETELSSAFKKTLSAAEERELEQLSSSLPNLQRRMGELSNARATLEAQKAQIQVELRENLRPMRDQLEMQASEAGAGGSDQKLQERQQELARLNDAVQALDTSLDQVEQATDEASSSLATQEQTRVGKQREQEEIAKTIEKSQRRSEKSIAKRSLLTEKAAEASRNIGHLGVIPDDAFSDKYNKLDSDKAIRRLHKVNDILKKYSHVNKKAFEQYANFTKQRETLTERREELDTSQKSIRELIDVLDQRKDEAIERTFKQVSREFANIFARLVPAGRGRLIIQRRSDQQARGDDDESGPDEREGVENYTGVGISVSFNSKHDEQQRIQQLSGGQKSLCALALVFAIQQCDPAPFYLFDEIDANLDAQYRTAVATLLQEIANNGQFICTTFRPEMVQVADKCYGVSFNNKTSRIDVVDRTDALDFVEGQISGQ